MADFQQPERTRLCHCIGPMATAWSQTCICIWMSRRCWYICHGRRKRLYPNYTHLRLNAENSKLTSAPLFLGQVFYPDSGVLTLWWNPWSRRTRSPRVCRVEDTFRICLRQILNFFRESPHEILARRLKTKRERRFLPVKWCMLIVSSISINVNAVCANKRSAAPGKVIKNSNQPCARASYLRCWLCRRKSLFA